MSLLAARTHIFRRSGSAPLVYGHRGARESAPENTLLSFDLAMQQGAVGVELDVRMSADGILLIHHDPHVRLRGLLSEVAISDLNEPQLRRLRLSSGEPIPTLREVLAWQARCGALLNIELKADVKAPLSMVRLVVQEVNRTGGDRILFSSFDPRLVVALKFHAPEIPRAQLLEPETPYAEFLATGARHFAQGLHPQDILLSPSWLAEVKAKFDDAILNIWTVNDEREAVRLADLGVDGLITDAPARILAALEA